MACEVCGKTYVWNPDENIDAKPHVCKTCGLSFSLKIQLKRHVETHANGEPYVCITCSTNPAQAESKSYNLRLNKKTDSYACDVCGESFSSKRMLLRHSIKEHCLENSDDSSSHESDSDDYEQPKKKRRQNFSTRKPRVLGSKRKETPPENKRYFCSNCNRGFVYQSYYDKHITEEKCLAQKTAPNSSKGNKKSKKTVVPDSKNHECDVCGKGFTRKSSLEGHMVLHAQEDSDDGPGEKDFYDSNDDESDDYVCEPKKPKAPKLQAIRKSYACEKCNFVCFSKPTFEKHSKIHEKEDIITEVKDVSAYIPISSSKTNNEKNKEKLSEEKVKETHLCEICDKVFVTKGRLKKHLMFHVTSELEDGDKDMVLPQRSFIPRVRQKRSKDFSCEVCGKQFAGMACLKKHSLKHQNEPDPTDPEYSEEPSKQPKSSSRKKKWAPPMECEFCHEIFEGKRSAYVKHLHSHTPEVCGICDERFVDRASLREHCKIHIGTEEGRIFVECSQKALEAKLGIMPPEPKVEYIYLMVR